VKPEFLRLDGHENFGTDPPALHRELRHQVDGVIPAVDPYPFTAMHTKRADDDGPGNRGKVHRITNENMENN